MTLCAISETCWRNSPTFCRANIAFGFDDRGVPMAKNIVFKLIVLELIGARFESRVAQDAVQVEHNVQPFPPWRRHNRMLNSRPDLFPPLRCYLNKTRQRRIGVTWLNAEVGEPVSDEMH